MRWNDFLYFRKEERRGILLLLLLIVCTLIINILLSNKKSSSVIIARTDSLQREFEDFRRSLQTTGGEEYPYNNHQYKKSRDVRHPGFLSDSGKLYANAGKRTYFTPAYHSTVKLAAGETISLNETDTAIWKKVPGIGSAYAARIVKYRRLLGGFYSKKQLQEVYGIDEELYAKILPFVVQDDNFSRLNVNELPFDSLLRHPYIDYKQAKVIIDLRRRKGRVESIEELGLLDEFTAEDLARLKPYLVF